MDHLSRRDPATWRDEKTQVQLLGSPRTQTKYQRIGTESIRPFCVEGNMAKPFARKFYSSKAWQDCRNEYAKRQHYLCENCMRKGIYKPGEIVHHMIELDPVNIENPEIALSFDNLILLCRDCHAEEHKAHNKGRRYMFGDDGKIILK